MLDSFPGFKTRDPEVNRQVALSEYGGRHMDCRSDGQKLNVKANWAKTQYARLTKVSCSVPTHVNFDPTTSVRQYFAIGKSTGMKFDANGRTHELSTSSRASVIIPADVPVSIITSPMNEHITLRLELSDLTRTLTSLLGKEVGRDIQFDGRLASDDWRLYDMQGAVLQFIRDLDALPRQIAFMAETFGQSLLVRFLLSTSHNYSSELHSPPAAPSLLQIQQIESYIEANWQREIRIDELARISGIGTRSIFRHFRKVKGISPHEFLRTIRLKKARSLLQSANDSSGVMEIALKCHFLHLGHFADQYHKAFGELPSQTLRRARSGLD